MVDVIAMRAITARTLEMPYGLVARIAAHTLDVMI